MKIRLQHKILIYSGLAATVLLATSVLYLSRQLDSIALEQAQDSLNRSAHAIDLLSDARIQKRHTQLSEWLNSEHGIRRAESLQGIDWTLAPQHDFLIVVDEKAEVLGSRFESSSFIRRSRNSVCSGYRGHPIPRSIDGSGPLESSGRALRSPNPLIDLSKFAQNPRGSSETESDKWSTRSMPSPVLKSSCFPETV